MTTGDESNGSFLAAETNRELHDYGSGDTHE
jgi:hypothetical protein